MMLRTPLAASVLAKTRTFAGPSKRQFGEDARAELGIERRVRVHLAVVLEVERAARRAARAPRASGGPNWCRGCRTASASTARPWASGRSGGRGAPRRSATSAISCGVGSGWTWVSATKTTPSSWIISDSAPIGRRLGPREDLAHVVEVPEILAEGAADQAVGLAAMDHHRADRRRVGAHDRARQVGGDAAPLHDRVIGSPVVAVARVVLGVHELEVTPDLQGDRARARSAPR